MSGWELPILVAAGLVAGVINAVVGSGSLVTFPALLAFGYPPVLANVTNNLGVLPASIAGAVAARRELVGEARPLVLMMTFSALGGLVGACLLLVLPAEAFRAIVPILICLALLLVIFGPRLRRAIASHRARRTTGTASSEEGIRRRDLPARVAAGLTGIYGGYFGAAQGVLLISLLSLTLRTTLNRANAYKNAATAAANGAAAVVFIAVSDVPWAAALAIAVGSTLGGWIGGTIGSRLPAVVYRTIIVIVGLAALAYFLAT